MNIFKAARGFIGTKLSCLNFRSLLLLFRGSIVLTIHMAILFSCVNVIRHVKVDAEAALSDSNRKFEKRFTYIEEKLKERNKTVEEATLVEMDELWEQSKEE